MPGLPSLPGIPRPLSPCTRMNYSLFFKSLTIFHVYPCHRIQILSLYVYLGKSVTLLIAKYKT